MIKIGDVEYRNIQEQVAKNASDIDELREEIANIDIEDSPEAIQNKQLGFAIIVDPLTNINGKSLTAYGTQPKTVGGYPTYQVYKTSAPSAPLSKDDASAYLLALSGLGYAPEYDFDHPKYHYFVKGDGTEYLKPQWDATNGLLLYRIPAPYQGKLTAGTGIAINSSNVISCTASGGTQLWKHSLWFEDETVSYYYSVVFISKSATPITNVYQLVDGLKKQEILSFVFDTGSSLMGAKILGAREQGAGVYEFMGYNYIMTDYESTPVFTSEQIDTENNNFPTANFHDTITQF